jgi:farnesol dehydrogenase
MTEGNSVSHMIEMFLGGRLPAIPGSGREVGNYVYVDDVVEGHMRAMARGRPGCRYLLAGENVSMDEFFTLVARACGGSRPRLHIPPIALRTFGFLEQARARLFHRHPLISPGWVETFLRNWAYSNDRARQQLGCRFRSLPDGVERTVRWLRQQNREAA